MKPHRAALRQAVVDSFNAKKARTFPQKQVHHISTNRELADAQVPVRRARRPPNMPIEDIVEERRMVEYHLMWVEGVLNELRHRLIKIKEVSRTNARDAGAGGGKEQRPRTGCEATSTHASASSRRRLPARRRRSACAGLGPDTSRSHRAHAAGMAQRVAERATWSTPNGGRDFGDPALDAPSARRSTPTSDPQLATLRVEQFDARLLITRAGFAGRRSATARRLQRKR